MSHNSPTLCTCTYTWEAYQGWRLLNQFLCSMIFPIFQHNLHTGYHIHIWQLSSQLSYGDICQISIWFKESKRPFYKIKNLLYGEINKCNFSKPHPRSATVCIFYMVFYKNKVNNRKEKMTQTCNFKQITLIQFWFYFMTVLWSTSVNFILKICLLFHKKRLIKDIGHTSNIRSRFFFQKSLQLLSIHEAWASFSITSGAQTGIFWVN